MIHLKKEEKKMGKVKELWIRLFRKFAPEELIFDIPQEREMLVSGTVPSDGVGALLGVSYAGKTTVSLNLAHCVSSGANTFLGKSINYHGDCLYISGEGLSKAIKDFNIYKAMTPSKHQIFFYKPENKTLHDPQTVDEIINQFKGIRFELIVIDTMQSCSLGANENSNDDSTAFAENADRLREELGGTVLITHHIGKNDAKKNEIIPRGGTGLTDRADFTLGLLKDKDDENKRLLVSPKSRNQPVDEETEFWLTNHEVYLEIQHPLKKIKRTIDSSITIPRSFEEYEHFKNVGRFDFSKDTPCHHPNKLKATAEGQDQEKELSPNRSVHLVDNSAA
ncbi:AAA family ATPase [Thiomicrospira sp. WB1]|uniref:AAA family ATPase n=1 Tax=Thiomicrospira sp. WB1 TaxID=1685380 RepID=UPI001F387D99|nr:AAA family ATPase [Thiomicrospira sp. WB1]